MSKKSDEQRYTDPGLRERIKEDIQASDRGGRPGQWSARKSQLLAREYEKQGGGYRGEKSGSQKDLERWTDEEWQTREGEARAREGDETKRYLPKEAWENMSESEKQETERKKREGSRQGNQYVENTAGAREARREARNLPIDGYEDLNADEVTERLNGLSGRDLKKVRDHEQQHGARKTVLDAIDKKL